MVDSGTKLQEVDNNVGQIDRDVEKGVNEQDKVRIHG